MTRGTLLVLMAVLWITAPLAAQSVPDTGPQQVLIMLQPQGPEEPRKIVVGPHAVATCKNNNGCADHFTMKWIGQKNEGERIRIEFTTPGSGDCFDHTYFTLDGTTGPGSEQKVTVYSEDHPLCKNKSAFFYDVSCIGGEGDNCGGVETLDPGAMVGGGPGGG
jgi:hypothetical protein